MTIERFEKHAGSRTAQGVDDPTMLLIGDFVPDTVTLPAELGGTVVTVAEAFVAACPVTGTMCRHLRLNATHGEQTLHVAESSSFHWYAK